MAYHTARFRRFFMIGTAAALERSRLPRRAAHRLRLVGAVTSVSLEALIENPGLASGVRLIKIKRSFVI